MGTDCELRLVQCTLNGTPMSQERLEVEMSLAEQVVSKYPYLRLLA